MSIHSPHLARSAIVCLILCRNMMPVNVDGVLEDLETRASDL